MENLNDKQKEAVMCTEGPLLIVAGAGAGKTKTIVERIIHLIKQGTKGENILGITFTNKAAAEMRERVESKIKEGSMPVLKTFHSLSVKIIRENAQAAGLSKSFSILDGGESDSRMKQALKNLGYDPKEIAPDKIKRIIAKAKQDLLTPESLEDNAKSSMEEIASSVWREYEKECRKDGVLDFDDLLVVCYKLLTRPDIRNFYHQTFKYVHVDEYQDTNNLEYNIVKMLVGPDRNLCVVGDADQNIYGWRGANIQNILRFERDWPGAKIVFLEQNYRSTKTILELANHTIEKNTLRIPKILRTENEDGEQATYVVTYNEMAEGHYVANECLNLIASGIRPEDIAILYRANFQSRVIEEAMLGNSVPYTVLGVRFFDRKEVKDLISYLRAGMDKSILGEVKRIINSPARGLGKVAVAKIFSEQLDTLPPKTKLTVLNFYKILDDLFDFMQKNPPSATVKYAITRSGLEADLSDNTDSGVERLENLEELVTLAKKFDHLGNVEGMTAFLDEAALHSDADTLDKAKSTGVRLMTVHSSKGLEFDTVFIVGLEMDLFPHSRVREAMRVEDKEEERRLFYVALTRAKRKLYLSTANVRTIYGNREFRIPSEFLTGLPSELIKFEGGASYGGESQEDEIHIL